MRLAAVLSLVTAAAAPAQDEARVQEAIRRGVAFLKTAQDPAAHSETKRASDLILLTLVHSGVPENNPVFQAYLRHCLEGPLEKTYNVAIQAMALEELDRVFYQARIAQCAQFLVDNQCKNGQWSYGSPTVHTNDIPTGDLTRRPLPAPSKGGIKEYDSNIQRVKPKVVRRIPVKKKRDGPAAGDNSNTQYGALGLRACWDAGIVIPEDVIQRARKWWTDSQHDPEGKDAIRGWNYTTKEKSAPTHSMTSAGVCALTIYDHMLDRDWKKDPNVKAGMDWLAAKFAVNANYYYMYGLERAGILYGTEEIGTHKWYAEGATFLLRVQKEDGSWSSTEADKYVKVWDTCFAILFLRRATRPLVATEAAGRKK